jgi:peptide chain release factor subunit 1
MPKTTTSLATPLREQLDRLAAFEPTSAPVLSLYLDLRANEQGKAKYDTFLRKAFAERGRSLEGDARQSFDADVARITAYLAEDVKKSANGVALFACSAEQGFFEAVQLEAPLDRHWLHVGPVPHLYPLARINDQFSRYAALLLDTNSARLFVFGLGGTEAQREVTSTKTRQTMAGGWSQARYQRHVENFHEQHMKEVVSVLDEVVRTDQIEQVIVACDAVAKPALMEQLPAHLAGKIIDVVALDRKAPEHEVIKQTMEVFRRHDADTDVARVDAMRDAWLGQQLGVAGPDDTLRALSMAAVEELLIVADPEKLARASDTERAALAGELVTMAQQQSARIRFIEDATLLEDAGGVGAILRFRIDYEQSQQGE